VRAEVRTHRARVNYVLEAGWDAFSGEALYLYDVARAAQAKAYAKLKLLMMRLSALRR
jgi:hypothetical protein